MKRCSIFTAALLAVGLPGLLRAAPVELGRESFEAAPGIGYTTSVAEFDDPGNANSDFFGKFPNDGARTRGVISGGDGSNAFMAEDIDQVPPVGPTQFLTTNSFNIAGKINTSVKILLAAPGTGPSGTVVNGGHQNHYDHDTVVANVDFVRVEASVDGGPFNRLIQFSPNTNALNQPLSLDADEDYLGGGLPVLNATFQEFDLPIPTGNSVQVRVVMHTNATNEYIVVDNLRIFGEASATASPVLAGVPGTVLTFVEGSAAQQLAPAITVTDTDSANMASATITIPSGYVNGEDLLSATPSGAILAGDIVFTPATGTLTITRSATKANYETVLRSVSYRNTNTSSPNTGTRQVNFRVNDGANTSNQPIRTVQISDLINTLSVPFTESFETDGRGTRYAMDGRFTLSANALFERIQPSGVTNLDGTFAMVGENTDNFGAPTNAVSFLVNTSGTAATSVSVRLGAPGGSVYDTGDLIVVEVSPTGLGGPWQSIAEFRSTIGFGGTMALDTDLNGVGDGTVLTAAMHEFSFSVPNAATLGLRIRVASNSDGERLLVDKVAVTRISDLAAYWDFNTLSTNGLAVDSRAGLAARILGGAVQTADAGGRSGLAGDRAMRFGTGNQRLHVPAPDGGYFTGVAAADKMSVSFWIKQNVTFTTPISFIAPAATSGGRGFQTHAPWIDQTIYFDTAGCCGGDTRTAVPTTGVTWTNWHHVALVKDGSAKSIYLDGTLLTTGSNIGSLALAFTELFIGNGPSLVEAVDGDMDDVAIFGAALSPSEVAILATQPNSALPITPNDTDGDGLPDKWERRFAANLGVLASVSGDPDADGLTNANEFAYGKNPLTADFLLVTTTADSSSGSLRDVLTTAAASPEPNLIRFDPALFNGEVGDQIVLTTSEIVINDPAGVIIDGSPITGGVTISGDNGRRIFRVVSGSQVSLRGLTILKGNGVGGGSPVNYGGAIHNQGTLSITGSTLTANSTDVGAAIYNATTGVLTVNQSTFYFNSASYGGAIQNEATLNATNVTFNLNSATTEGGAISAPFNKPVVLKHCTLTGNNSPNGGAAVGNNISLENCICVNNTTPNLSGTPTFLGNNITTGDPKLGPIANYGGPTITMVLLPGSPARNAATVLIPARSVDQRGFPIVGIPDIGAYEAGTVATNYNAYIYETLPSTATTPQYAGTFDFDKDGATNTQEWAALTDAANAGSVFRIISAVRSGGNVIITFPTVIGKSYTLWRSDTLSGSWVNTGAAALTGNGSNQTFTVPTPAVGVGKRFHRVQVGP